MPNRDPGTDMVKFTDAGDMAPAEVLEAIAGSEESSMRLEAFKVAASLERSRLVRAASAALANMSWGTKISEAARAAVARWAYDKGIDPLRHIFILGGRIYDAAELYIDKAAADPSFDHYEVEILAPLDTRTIDPKVVGDKNVAKLQVHQQDINARRLQEQMTEAVDPRVQEFPKTSAAVRVTAVFKDGSRHVGVKVVGSLGRRKKRRGTGGQMIEGGSWDPVGDQAPVLTAITRAMRKALKQRIPLSFDAQNDESLSSVQGIIAQGREAAKALPSDGAQTLQVPLDAGHVMEVAPPGPIPVTSRESLVNAEKTFGDDLTPEEDAELERQQVESREEIRKQHREALAEATGQDEATDEDERVRQEDMGLAQE
jgi:hypothetical protein